MEEVILKVKTEAQRKLLLDLAKQLKIAVVAGQSPSEASPRGIKQDSLTDDLEEALTEVKDHMDGKIKLKEFKL